MWMIILTIIIILLALLLLVAAIIAGQNKCPPPPPPPPKEEGESTANTSLCGRDVIILYNGNQLKLLHCDNHGKLGNSDYIILHKDVRTYVPFRPTKIEGEYNTLFITRNTDEVDQVYIHTKQDGMRFEIPLDWKEIYVTVK